MSSKTTKATISTKGHLIDPQCQYQTGRLLEYDDSVYSCTLNQTDIKTNKNKFYIMQIIHEHNKYIVYIRYGRIGENGRIDYKEYTDVVSATNFFAKQFRSKTGNSWSDRDNFVKKDGKYFMAEIESVDEPENLSENSDSDDEDELDPRVEDFIKLISNTNYMKNTLVQLEIDTKKMPLGKISQTQIDRAYEILNTINQNLGNHNHSKLVKLSSEFYTLVPYACGRNIPPVIDSPELVGKFVNLLNELSQVVAGNKTIVKLKKNLGTIVKLYQELHTEIVSLEKTDPMYKILSAYLKNSKAPTHHFNFDIMNIFEINRESERETYDKYTTKKKIGNKTLLFHGTRVCNIISVLKNGLVVDPSKLGINVSITGKMFGLGLYYANSCSKSIQYCAYDLSDNIACLFVAEVALGNMLEKKKADPSLTAANLPKQYQSTRGIGISSFEEYDELDDGVRIPKGKLKSIPANAGSVLLYDEFIVYHEEQINLRYIIQLKIH